MSSERSCFFILPNTSWTCENRPINSKQESCNSHFKTLLGLNLNHFKGNSVTSVLRCSRCYLSVEAGWPAVCLTDECGMHSAVARQRWHSAAQVGALPSGVLKGALLRANLLSCRVTLCSCHPPAATSGCQPKGLAH